MFDELFENPAVIVLSLLLWAVVCFFIWKSPFGETDWVLSQKVIFTVAALPTIFLITNWKLSD